MTIFFAASRAPEAGAIELALTVPVPPDAANDHRASRDEALLRAALRHFARHGMAAAEQAARSAQAAFRDGREDDCGYWLAICQTLDRRLAATTRMRLRRAQGD